jgi:hypothetical protein
MFEIKLEDFLRVVGEIYPKEKGVKEGEKAYDECFKYREKWDDLSSINEDDVENIMIPFLNKWKCRLSDKCTKKLTSALKEVEPLLQPLRHCNIESTELLASINMNGETLRILTLVEKVFNRIYTVKYTLKAGQRTVGFTAASKILHIIVPSFFVMSDEKIRKAYGCEGNEKGYANFMFRMSLLARDLVSQANGDKEKILKCSKWEGRTLAKLLDVFNYTKFTLKKNL